MNIADKDGTAIVESNPPPGAEPPSLRRFRARLMDAAPVERLSPLEERILAITARFYMDSITLARCARLAGPGDLPAPVSAEIVAEGARLALAAAIEIEDPLRTIRDRLERPR